MNRRPELAIIAPGATAEEAAAVVAALERFMRDTAPAPTTALAPPNPWRQAALLEGIDRAPSARPPWA